MSDSRVARLTRKQHGLVTKRQVLTVLTDEQLRRRLRQRRLEPVRMGVYRVGGAPQTWHQDLMAACLAAGSDSRVSFRAAAALWRLDGFSPDVLEITVAARTRRRLDGVIVHDTEVDGPEHLALVEQIPVTSMARTLCDLSAVVRAWTVERAVDEALRRKLVTLPSLTRVADSLDGRGRRRGTVMREIVAARAPGFHPGESAPELRISRALVAAGLPAPVHQCPFRIGNRTVRADLAYPDAGIVIEYDGWDFHSTRTAFDSDRARANELEILGLTVLRFTSKSSDAQVVATVRAALGRACVTAVS